MTQEQFDELLHKFSLLEQLMQQDKSKISDLETSVDLFQKDKQQYRQSFTDIDNEVMHNRIAYVTLLTSIVGTYIA